MKRGLRYRLSLLLVCMVVGMLLLAGISLMVETHYHFQLYQEQYGTVNNLQGLTFHLEQALLQSMMWTLIGTVVLAAMISLYVAKRLSAPLIDMKEAAEKITRGDLSARTNVPGNDELSELGNALNHLAAQLQKQEQLRVTMTQDIAHELRTPLTTLKSHIQAMLDQIWEPTPARLQACYEETERLIMLVSDLEQLTEMDSPHFRLHRKPENLTALIEQSVRILSAAFLEKGIRLEVGPHPDLRLNVDRDRLIQILVNVLSNSLKFTPEGGQVEIRVKDENDSVLITVQDTGPGIAPEDLPYVFERFYRADKSRNRKWGGSGIGLTIVKKLVDAHGGTVWIESGHGTKVYIRLPKECNKDQKDQ